METIESVGSPCNNKVSLGCLLKPLHFRTPAMVIMVIMVIMMTMMTMMTIAGVRK